MSDVEFSKEKIDGWIEAAGLSEIVGVFDGAIELDAGYYDRGDELDLPKVSGVDVHNSFGYRVLAKLFITTILKYSILWKDSGPTYETLDPDFKVVVEIGNPE